jgi:transcriptional regulator with XRE-family HTH domain
VPDREVKFGQMLETLIERRGYSRNRKRILSALDISAAALSQYVREQTRPSFSKLLALADFFDVTLDYLVYGQASRSETQYEPVVRYVDHALADVQARGSRHSAIVARIGRVLADQINEVASELASAPTAAREGLVQDDEMLRLERYCLHVDIVSLNLEFDVIQVEGGAAAGRFLNVVANNLQMGSRYRFLVPAEEEVSAGTVTAFRSLLAAQVGGDQVHENCAFRCTRMPLMTGIALYRLNADVLEMAEPALYAQFAPHMSEAGWLGCVIRPNGDSNSDMLMDSVHIGRAQAAFDALWISGRPL